LRPAPPSGIIGWWPGDGSAADIVGANDGTLFGTATYAPGLVGEAFSFDGSGACVELPPVSAGLPEGTIEFWCSLNSWNWQAAGNGMFLWSGTEYAPGSGAGWDWMDLGTHPCCTSTGDLMFGIFDGGWQWAHSGVVPQTNAWYHVAGTWGPGGLCIYVNGLLMGINAYTGGAPSDIVYNLIGCTSWPNSGRDGLIDEVSLYNRALSASEIAAIFLAGSAGKCKGLPVVLNIVQSGIQTVVSWPTNPPGYALQWTTNLALPIAWSASTSTPVILGAQFVVTNANSGGAQFFRLQQQ
jgi:hypothetical protein